MDPTEMRFRAQQSPRSDATTMNSLISPPRSNRLSQTFQPPAQQDPRSNLSRRFTTDSGRVPTLSSNIGPRGPDQEYQVHASLQQLQLLDKKRMEYEKILEQKRLFEAEMAKHELELSQMMEEHGRLSGHQSEPTTPPEYRETTTGFPSVFSRPNRYSLSSLTSPQGAANRSSRSGSVLASPQSGIPMSRFAFDDQLPSWSHQTSRRNSDEDEKEEAVRQDPTSHRSTNAVNRYSMPVTKSRTGFYDIGLDQANTTGFLFGDDDSAPEAKLYTQTNTDDNFPTLIRRDNMSTSEASSIARPANTYRHSLEMKPIEQKFVEGASEVPAPANNANVLATPPKLQPSFSANDVPTLKSGSAVGNTPNQAAQQHLHNHNASMGRIPQGALPNRHSRELSVDGRDTGAAVNYQSIGSTLHANAVPFGPSLNQTSGLLQGQSPAHIQASGLLQGQGPALTQTPQAPAVVTMASPQAHTPAHTPTSHSPAAHTPYNNNGYYTPAGYSNGSPAGYNNGSPAGLAGSVGHNGHNGHNGLLNGSAAGSMTGGYPAGVPMLSMQMSGLSVNGSNSYTPTNSAYTTASSGYSPASSSGYSPANYAGYGPAPVYGLARARDSQARVMQNRRQQDNEAMGRFNGQPLEAYGGSIYELCKDQHGCRYLQKQLEHANADQVRMIWLETCSHVVELMTDPFGNYLCQKLFEYCNDDERTVLVQNAAKDMVRIALNQHGTRALQKMIENIQNPDEVAHIIAALSGRVVELIQDLNGNHVIQKCLNKLDSHDSQFIFDAVGNSCVEVGTHRHGCCVLQRCIDHADGEQKVQLIQRITQHAVTLVQDPFGNYVVQYIIDLNEPMFTEPVAQQFLGRINQLSRHKFSSNVIEKCIRCASDQSKDQIVVELLDSGEMERLIRDAYANYVVQTALEFSTMYMKQQLVETIRPILPAVRQTPYGRKIQAKVNAYDASGGHVGAIQQSATDPAQSQVSLHPIQRMVESSVLAPGYQKGANGGNGNGNGNVGSQNYSSTSMVAAPHPQRQPYGPPPQQFANRISPYAKGNGSPYAKGNGSPYGTGSPYAKSNGSPGTNGLAPNGANNANVNTVNAPGVADDGEQNFF